MFCTVRCSSSATLLKISTIELDEIAKMDKQLTRHFLKYITRLQNKEQEILVDYLPSPSMGNFKALNRKRVLQNVVFNIIIVNRQKNSRPSLSKAIEILKAKGFDRSLIEE